LGGRDVAAQNHARAAALHLLEESQSRVIAGRARTEGAVITLVERDYSAIWKELLTRTRSSAVVTDSLRIKAGDLSKTTLFSDASPITS